MRSCLEYASTVNHWSSLEIVQRRATRWILSDYGRHSNVTNMLQKLGLETLEDRCRYSRLAFPHKVLHEEVRVSPNDLLSGAE